MSTEAYLAGAATCLRNPHSSCPEFRDQRQRKQHVIELEQKIRAYEQAGIIATKSVEAAAQVVAAENAALRNLARARLGWSEQALDRYISLGICHDQNPTSDMIHGTIHYCHCQKGLQCLIDGSEQQPTASSHAYLMVQNTPIREAETKNEPSKSISQLDPPSHVNPIEARDLSVIP